MERNRWIYDLIYCGGCACHVPVFRDLGPSEQALVDRWMTSQVHHATIAEATGMKNGHAKSWVLHRQRPIERKGKWNSTPCPHCGRWLRGPKARQCFHCGADWH